MQRLNLVLASLLFMLSGMVWANAPAVAVASLPVPDPAPTLMPAPPQVNASSYILMDAASGKVLIEQNSDQRLPPASLTKMMTAYITEYETNRGNLSMNSEVLISVNAWRTGGSKMFIKEGNRVPLIDLLRGIIIQSGNDASIAVAEHIAGTELAFADIMNQHAKILGMENSHFRNATGLPDEDHYSSAHDLAILAKAIIYDFPESYALYKEKYFVWNGIKQPNRNRLLWRDSSVDGLKTGHTDAAGYCLVASAVRDNMRLISVVMGTQSEEARARETQKLLNYGFRFFESVTPYKSGQEITQSKIWGGTLEQLKLGVASDLVYTITRGQQDKVELSVEVNPVIQAPVNMGDVLGTIKVTMDGSTLAEQPLVALEPVAEAGFFKRIWDMVVLFFVQLFS